MHPMRRSICALLVVATIALSGTRLKAEPPAKSDRKNSKPDVSAKTTSQDLGRGRLIESANGWMYVNSEWVHPDGYKFVNNKVLRTTAKAGKAFPKPPGKLALENPTKLTARPNTNGTRTVPKEPQTAAEKAADARRKNLTPTPASQTGTHL
jgi:hypothetical protein